MKPKEIDEIKKSCETDFFHEDSLVGEIVGFSELEYKTDKTFNRKVKNYRKQLKEISKEHFTYLHSQYVAFELFKRGGLLKKCLRKMDLDYWPGDELDFVKYSAKNPWRYSYCEIIDNPAEDIYIMRDCFSYEEFTLYSTGVTKLQEKEDHIILTWFMLIYHNGKCYQAYGPLTYFNGFLADDIYFFATEKNPAITSEKELMADLNRDPIPYMMLVAAGRIPLNVWQGHAVQYFFAAIDAPMPHFKLLQREIDLDHKKGVYRMGLKNYAMSPHFSRAYYDPKKRELQLHALTEEGFEALAHIFKKHKLATEILPDIIVSPAMINVIANILDKKVKIDHYEHLFKSKIKLQEEYSEPDKINHFLTILTDKLSIVEEPDIIALAQEAGISLSTAKNLFESIKNNGLASVDYYLEDEHEQDLRKDMFLDFLMDELQRTNEPDIDDIARDAGIPIHVALELYEPFKGKDPKIFKLPDVSEAHEKEAKEEEALDYFRDILAEEMEFTEEPDIENLANEAGIPMDKAMQLYEEAKATARDKFKSLLKDRIKIIIGPHDPEKTDQFLDRYFEESVETKVPDTLNLAEEVGIPLNMARGLLEIMKDIDMKTFKDPSEEYRDSGVMEFDEVIQKVEIYRDLLTEELIQTEDPDIEKLAKKAEISVDYARYLYKKKPNMMADLTAGFLKLRVKPLLGPHDPEKVNFFLDCLVSKNQQNKKPDIKKLAKEVGIPLTMAQEIFDKLIDVIPKSPEELYNQVFRVEEEEEENEEYEKLRNENKFLKLLKEKLEQGEVPNYENLAKEAGIPMETVNEYKRSNAVAQTIKNLLKNSISPSVLAQHSEKIDQFLDLFYIDFEKSKKPDIDNLAKEVGLPNDVAWSLLEILKNYDMERDKNLFAEDNKGSGKNNEDSKSNHFMRLLTEEMEKDENPDIESLAKKAGISIEIAEELFEELNSSSIDTIKNFLKVTLPPSAKNQNPEKTDRFLDRFFEEVLNSNEPNIDKLAKEAGIPKSTAWDLYEKIEKLGSESAEYQLEEDALDSEDEYLAKAEHFLDLLAEEFDKTDDPDLKKLAKEAGIPLSLAMHLHSTSNTEVVNKMTEFVGEKIKPLIGPHNPEKVDLFLQRLIEETQQPQEPDIEKMAKEVGIPVTMARNILDKFRDIDPKEIQDHFEQEDPEYDNVHKDEIARRLGHFLDLVEEELKQTDDPDVEKMAKEAGMPFFDAQRLFEAYQRAEEEEDDTADTYFLEEDEEGDDDLAITLFVVLLQEDLSKDREPNLRKLAKKAKLPLSEARRIYDELRKNFLDMGS